MAWDYNALKAAHRTAALIVGPTGKPMNVNLDTFVCSRGFAPHQRAIEILGAMNKGWIPGSADRDGPGVPTYKVIALPWVTTNTSYWWMFDSSLKGPTYGPQYKESQPIELEGPNIVFKTGEIQYKARHQIGLEKSLLIHGENPAVDNAYQAEKQVQRLNEGSLLTQVCNSLNTVYNFITKTVSWAEMFQPALTL